MYNGNKVPGGMFMWTKDEKKELKIFSAITFGFTALMSIFMGFSYYNHGDASIAVITQMLYPMTGVILAVLYNRKSDEQLPKKFFVCFLVVVGLMIVCSVCIAFFSYEIWDGLANIIVCLGSLACFGFYFWEERENMNHYKLRISETPLKTWVKYSLLFIAMIVFMDLVQQGLEIVLGMKNVVEIRNEVFSKEFFSTFVSSAVSFVPAFFMQFIFFLGEEYGWRGFLQPLLQKRFGMRKGIFILGVIWGIWHLPVSMFEYSPDGWHIQIVSQIFLCVFYAIFFGYVYLKTKSVWLVAWLHYMTNFIAITLNGGTAQQKVSWENVLIFAAAGMICYLPFIKSKVFTDKSILEDMV